MPISLLRNSRGLSIVTVLAIAAVAPLMVIGAAMVTQHVAANGASIKASVAITGLRNQLASYMMNPSQCKAVLQGNPPTIFHYPPPAGKSCVTSDPATCSVSLAALFNPSGGALISAGAALPGTITSANLVIQPAPNGIVWAQIDPTPAPIYIYYPGPPATKSEYNVLSGMLSISFNSSASSLFGGVPQPITIPLTIFTDAATDNLAYCALTASPQAICIQSGGSFGAGNPNDNTCTTPYNSQLTNYTPCDAGHAPASCWLGNAGGNTNANGTYNPVYFIDFDSNGKPICGCANHGD